MKREGGTHRRTNGRKEGGKEQKCQESKEKHLVGGQRKTRGETNKEEKEGGEEYKKKKKTAQIMDHRSAGKLLTKAIAERERE